MQHFCLIFILITYPFFCFSVGKATLRLCKINEENCSISILFGLVILNYLTLALKLVGISWLISNLTILILSIFLIYKLKIKFSFKNIYSKIDLNILLWVVVVAFIGISIFSVNNGIKTLWVSNYGDLTFHIGMITSFVFGDNFPPEYHLYPGLSLTYPFLINFWSASLWSISSTWHSLSLIFMYQWCFLWMCLYFILDGSKNKFIPWVVLLGGGVLSYYQLPIAKSIEGGGLWVPLLGSIWVPQRSALFGAVCLLSIFKILAPLILDREYVVREKVVFSSILIVLMPLIHTHLFIVSLIFVTSIFFYRIKMIRKEILYFSLMMLLLIPWYFYLSNKSGVLDLVYGFNSSGKFINTFSFKNISEVFIFWITNWISVFVILAILFYKMKNRLILLSLLLLFLIGNFVKLSFWSFDQIKFFLGLYLLIVAFWNVTISSKDNLNYFLILLILPGFINLVQVVVGFNEYKPYSKSQLNHAENIIKMTNEDAIILAKTDHNSTVTLTGRKLYLGYIGTMSSHGIDYRQREKLLKKIPEFGCVEDICPNYLYINNSDKKFFPNMQKTRMITPYLYKIIK